MSSNKKNSNRGLPFRLGAQFISRGTSDLEAPEQFGHVLNKDQKKKIRKLQWITYTISALIGATAVLIVILPYHLTAFFKPTHIEFWGISIDYDITYFVYAIAIIFPEIWLLNVVNIRAVRTLCRIYRFPSVNSRDYNEQVDLLTEAGLEIPSSHMMSLGIDPYVGMTRLSYYALFLFNKIKASLTNVAAKFIVRRLLGRYALRIVTDLVGVPIYAFWDAWSSHLVIKETKLRISSYSAINDFMKDIRDEQLYAIRQKLPDLINFIAQQKRQYNFSLYAFIQAILLRIPDLSLRTTKEIKAENLLTGNTQDDLLISHLMIFGMIIDGTLSLKERLVLKNLSKEDWFPLTVSEVDDIVDGYIQGQGVRKF